ncbi:hypothetical protein MHUMG1_04673 [Metarhizium humberi]|uniref:ADF-H domain-containing protein n=1 Tax=Metarhizium humberi TaxID=2596975 RepID=A0A9P8M9K5_9HYPO|nr:hypothetical protein MHUMG1_04673 [Metarhizium humberi]
MCSRCDIAPRGRGNICCAFSRTRPLGGSELLWHSLAASILSWYGALYALLLRCSVASRSRPADAIHPASKASESRLYTFSGETKEHLRKFRLTTSRAKDPQAVIYMIDKNTHEIRQALDDYDEARVYKSLKEVAEDLPDHTPRFVLLSYPITTSDGRLSVPYVLLYYLPITCNAEVRMLYAGAKELMRSTSEAGSVIDIESAEDLEEVPEKLASK